MCVLTVCGSQLSITLFKKIENKNFQSILKLKNRKLNTESYHKDSSVCLSSHCTQQCKNNWNIKQAIAAQFLIYHVTAWSFSFDIFFLNVQRKLVQFLRIYKAKNAILA